METEAELRLVNELRRIRLLRPLDIADIIGAIHDCDLKLVTNHSAYTIPPKKAKMIPRDPKDW